MRGLDAVFGQFAATPHQLVGERELGALLELVFGPAAGVEQQSLGEKLRRRRSQRLAQTLAQVGGFVLKLERQR